MTATLALNTMAQQDQKIAQTIERERDRLRGFIRSRVRDESDAEDILAEVFGELVEAERLMQPIEQVGAWLFRVARNRIIDLFRRRQTAKSVSADAPLDTGTDGAGSLEDLLPSPDAGPDALFARRVLVEELEQALAELPAEQREVFLANEIDGRGFREMSEETGVSINTLLSRKRYAVLHLRERLKSIQQEFADRGGN